MFEFFLRIFPPEQKRRPGVDLDAPDIRWSLMQLRRFGFIPKHVMDVRAFKGDGLGLALKCFLKQQSCALNRRITHQRELKKLASE